jgi:hypothetical protein
VFGSLGGWVEGKTVLWIAYSNQDKENKFDAKFDV